MQPPRYETSTILNRQTLDACIGGVFYGLHNAVETAKQLVSNRTCRSVTVKDRTSGDVVYHLEMLADAPFYKLPYWFED